MTPDEAQTASTARQLLYLLTLFPRLMGTLAIGALDGGAVVIGLRWRDSRGRTHWKDSLR